MRASLATVTRLLTCFMEHFSLSSLVQVAMLGLSKTVFLDLDWGALRVKQRFAAEVMRLEAAGSDHMGVVGASARVSRDTNPLAGIHQTPSSSSPRSQCSHDPNCSHIVVPVQASHVLFKLPQK